MSVPTWLAADLAAVLAAQDQLTRAIQQLEADVANPPTSAPPPTTTPAPGSVPAPAVRR